MAFPVNPVNGQLYTTGGYTYQWSSTKYAWTNTAVTAANIGNVIIANTSVTANTATSATTLTGNNITIVTATSNTEITANTLFTGNTTANTSVSNNIVTVSNPASNTAITSNVVTISVSTSNTAITSNNVVISNSTSNTNTAITSNVVTISAPTSNTSITSNVVTISVPTSNTAITSNNVVISNSTSNTNTSITSNVVIVSDPVSNTSITSDTIIVGNTTSNTTVNIDSITTPSLIGNVVSATGNITSGNVSTVGLITATGNVSGNYILGNGSQLTGIDATSIQNGSSNVRVTANGNITVGVAGTSNVVVFANTGAFVTGIVSVTGNVIANGILTNNYYYANGTPVDFEQPAGSNTQIQFNNNNSFGASGALVFDSASNIFTVGGNIVGNNVSTNAVTSTGQLNISSAVNGNILLDPDGTGIFKIVGSNGFVVPVGNTAQRPDYPTYATVDTGTLRLNSTLNQLEIWNGAIWSIVGSDSGNISIIDQQITPDGSSTAYVLTQVATAASIIVSLNGVVQIPNDGYTVTGNSLTFIEPPLTTDIVDIRFLTGVNAPSVLYNSSGNSSVQVTDTPDVVTTVNNVVKSRVNAVGLSVTGNITGSGNVAGTYFIGNGAFLTGISGSSYGNANVAANLAAFGSNPILTTGNITAGNISATGSILATPAWTSAGATTITATTTNPTKGTTTSDNISYRQLGAKQWEIILTYIQTVANGVNGSGDYLFTLPNGLSFDATLPSQQIYTTNIGTNTYALMSYIIPSGSGLINNDSLGGQVYPIVYDATKFRILTTSWGSAIQCWGSGYYSLGGDDPKIQLTFRFTST